MSAKYSSRALFLAIASILIGGCGGSPAKPRSAGRTTSASSPSTPSTPSIASAAAAPRPKPSQQTGSGAPKHVTAPGIVSAAPASAAAQAAPDGLRAATGYSSYDLCEVGCSGSAPASLRRPLHLPAAGGSCPVSATHRLGAATVLGSGRVGPVQSPALGVMSFIGSAWSGARVLWVADPGYNGPVLIRGRGLGGAHAIGFGEGHVPDDELQFLTTGPSAAGPRNWPSFTRVRGPGCYAYQVDGSSFSSVIVFRAG